MKGLLLMMSVFMCNILNAQEKTGTIKGSITTNDGKPAADVTVLLQPGNKGTITDENGNFGIYRIKEGSYLLTISLTGYKTIEEKVEVTNGSVKELRLQLQLSEKQLQEIIISSGTNKFARRQSNYVARMPLSNLENPQNYTVVGKALIEEQVITNFNDVVKNSSGIDKLWSSTGRATDGAAYFAMRGFAVQPSMINGIAGQTNGGLDPANIEQVEIIKGPSGTLFGSSLISFGGLINIVTKKPTEVTKGEVTYTNGTFGLNRVTADYNTALNASKTVLFRINGAYHYENSFQDAGFRKSVFAAPSLIYKPNDRFNIHLNAEFYNSESTNPVMIFLNRSRQLIYRTPQELNIDYTKSFTSNDITVRNPTYNFFGQVNYKLSNNWTSQTSYSQSVRRSDGLYQYVMFLQPTNDTLLDRYIANVNFTGITTNFQQNFIGDFKIGSVRNRMVAGIDVSQQKGQNNNTAYILFDRLNSQKYDSRYAQLTRQSVETRLGANSSPAKSINDLYTYGAYVSNVTNITDRLLLMTSLRVDRFDNKGTKSFSTGVTSGAFAQTAVSPKLGIVYAVLKDRVSVFANYMNGFRNVAPGTQPDGSVTVFKPQQANQWEAGVKLDALKGRLSGSVSYYDILVKNVVIPDPQRTGFTIQEGDVVSRGFEMDIISNPFAGFNIVAGYSYNDSKNTNAAPATKDRRPVNAGPQQLANLWLSYALQQGKLKGAGVGFGGNYASENIITNSSTTGEFTIPAYTVLNAGLFYNTRAFRIAVKADNITNLQYWKGWTTIEPQMPRRISASVAIRF